MKHNAKNVALLGLVLLLCLVPGFQVFAQTTSTNADSTGSTGTKTTQTSPAPASSTTSALDTSTPLDENNLFGEQNQLVTVIDAATAA